MLANNKVAAVEPNFAEVCPKLDSVILTNNRLSKFEDIDNLSSCQTLQRLCLIGNLVCNLQDYRLYTIHKIPSLRVLDFQMVSQTERETASKLFSSETSVRPTESMIQKVVMEDDQEMGNVAASVNV